MSCQSIRFRIGSLFAVLIRSPGRMAVSASFGIEELATERTFRSLASGSNSSRVVLRCTHSGSSIR